MIHKIQFNNSKGEKLAGILNIPFGKSKIFPAIILAHGFGYHMHEDNMDGVPMFDELARTLCENGFLTLQFDFTGCGESEGDFSKTTLTSHVADLNSALEIVKKLPFVDTKRIGIVGMSFGTAVTVAFMGRNRFFISDKTCEEMSRVKVQRGDTTADLFPADGYKEIKSIVLLSSCKSPKDQIAKIFQTEGKYNPEAISSLERENEKPVNTGPQFWKDFDNYNFPDIIKNIHIPLMMIHGEKDDLVGRKIDDYFALANNPKELHVIKNTQHGYEGKQALEEMMKLVLDWFKKWL